MICNEFKELIPEFLGGKLVVDDQLESFIAHMMRCKQCERHILAMTDSMTHDSVNEQ